MLVPARYVWLTWASIFFVVWLTLFIWFPRYRLLMWWSSLLALPFGLSEPFFLLHYWHPQSLFNLTNTIHADLESFLFCFSIGGTAAVAYHVVVRQPVDGSPSEIHLHHWFWQAAGALAPVPAFVAVLALTNEIIWAGLAGFVAGIGARMLLRPELAAKTLIGGLVFFGYYVALLELLNLIAPGYMDRAWNPQGPAAVRIANLPATELMFGVAFGCYWSGLFEQLGFLLGEPTLRRQP